MDGHGIAVTKSIEDSVFVHADGTYASLTVIYNTSSRTENALDCAIFYLLPVACDSWNGCVSVRKTRQKDGCKK
jgi:hypothetical protein